MIIINSSVNKQVGMTLVEILLALVLGISLIAGILNIFVSSNQSSRMLNGLSRLQENGHFALDFISRDIRSAGHRARVTGVSVCLNDKSVIAVDGTNDLGVNASDTLVLRQSSCSPAHTIIYSIANGASGRRSLFKSDNGNNQELVEDVDNMQIEYGADTTSDGSPDYFVSAGTATLDMSQVVSVRVTLAVKTTEGEFFSTSDGRIEREFASTIALRNRLK